jgi:protoporphyrinogen IX oxidase
MLWVKAFHIVFVTAWFAGLFYLPRIFVNIAMEDDESARDRLLVMAQKLYNFMRPLAAVALGLGLWLWLGYDIGKGSAWLHAKLAVVVLIIGYHHACGRLLKQLLQFKKPRNHRWYRWFNEFPVLLLAAAVILAVVKPFQ